MKTLIYFYDPGNEDYKSKRRVWNSLGDQQDIPVPCELTNGEDLPLQTADGQEPNANDRFVCLIHWSRLNFPSATVTKWAKAHTNARFIVISGGGQATPTNTPANVHYYRPPVGSLEADGKFKTDFHTWYRVWSAGETSAWGPLDADDGPILAFRLLCEAKRACGGDAKKEDYNGTGITIHAPQDIGQWLAPFGKKPEENQAIDEVAEIMGSGEIKIKTKAVLQAVSGTEDELKIAIKELLKEAAKPSA